MEIREALEFCLRRLRTDPAQLRRLALSLSRPGPDMAEADEAAPRPGLGAAEGAQDNRAVLRVSQEVLAETIARLGQENP